LPDFFVSDHIQVGVSGIYIIYISADHLKELNLRPIPITDPLEMRGTTKLISNDVFGMLIFVLTEVMFFVALISTFIVIKGGNGGWDIPENVRLPILNTAFNTLVLVMSGVLLFLAGKKLESMPVVRDQASAGTTNPTAIELHAGVRTLILRSLLLGAFFVVFQGYEWTRLIAYGLTMKSNIYGACFFLLIGSHGLHALAGVFVLLYLYVKSNKAVSLNHLRVTQVFWFFIVGIWPFLYYLVYF